MRKSNKKWVFLWVFFINFYGFSASRYVMTTLDEFHIIPPGEFYLNFSVNHETPLGVFFIASTTTFKIIDVTRPQDTSKKDKKCVFYGCLLNTKMVFKMGF